MFKKKTYLTFSFFLSIIWIICVFIVNPIGDFPLNDDWSYSLNARALAVENKIYFDDWGAMTLFAHTVWGTIFCKIFGYSYTVLRCSTLVIGLIGIIASFFLFREAKIKETYGFLLAILLAFNPIYFNLSYTYMTDVPFLSFSILSAYFFLKNLNHHHIKNIIFATFFSIIATLIRQPGILIPIAFLIVSILKNGYSLSLKSITYSIIPSFISVLCMVLFIDWRETNYGLSNYFGSLTDVFKNLTNGTFNYFLSEKTHGFFMYWGVFSLPVLFTLLPTFFKRKDLKLQLSSLILTILSSYPYWKKWKYDFHGNIFYNVGLGPRTLAETPDGLQPPEFGMVSPEYWNGLKFIAFMAGMVLLFFIWKKGLQTLYYVYKKNRGKLDWAALFGFAISIGYFIFLLTNNYLYDRYYLTVFPFLLLIIIPKNKTLSIPKWAQVLASLTLAFYILFSIGATKDYLEWNKSRWKAINFALEEKDIPTDHFNGGFELRNWKNKKVKTPGDWENYDWWLNKDDHFTLAFSQLCGYETVDVFSNKRYFP